MIVSILSRVSKVSILSTLGEIKIIM